MDIRRCLLYWLCTVWFALEISAVTDIMNASQALKDGETLVSSGGSFEVGFFTPGSSNGLYLGIWYKNIPDRTVVWVANRQNPIVDSSGMLLIDRTGNLVLSNRTNGLVWSTALVTVAKSPVVQLLDTGNLVVRNNDDGNEDSYLWQSFDYPSDTLLPGMKLGWDLRTSLERRLSSWKSLNDPSPGELNIGIELDPYPQKVMWKGANKFFRGGPWNGLRFSGAPELRRNPLFDFRFVSNEEEIYYVYELLDGSVITRFVLNDTTSTHERYVWIEVDQSWRLYAYAPRDYCDNYDLCGANGVCVITGSPVCRCLDGFKPKSAQRWNSMDWSDGCERDEPFNCSMKNDFVKFSSLKLPDTKYTWVNKSMNLRECNEACLRNCSCTAYSNFDITRGSGCALWFGDLVDIRQFSDGGQDLYIRMQASSNHAKMSLVIVAAIVVPFALICGSLLVISYWRRREKAKDKDENTHDDTVQKDKLDLPFVKLSKVSRATENFSAYKKLGEGGYGPVYKGILGNRQEIAVKRLSNSSGQGLDEFKNEVKLITRLQHRNLVKLLGCCIDDHEKILIYEYMPNGSLDSFLFEDARRSLLDWSKRFHIICGIARGLLYLHQDSRLRVIHRDLKASNVLLDNDLNPKISDFGLARTFGGENIENKTKRIVGTYGYMAPEYAIYGSFSVKSDVYSFGILILEIVSGKKNLSDDLQDHHNLIGYVWKLWMDERPLEAIDKLFHNMPNKPEMIRCIHVALLCLQQNPVDRPSMPAVVLMLNGESLLPQPKEPGFLIDFIPSETHTTSRKKSWSVNDITISVMDPR